MQYPDYITLNGMIDECFIGRDWNKALFTAVRYCSGIYLEGQKKTVSES
jgi:hypothetical protein